MNQRSDPGFTEGQRSMCVCVWGCWAQAQVSDPDDVGVECAGKASLQASWRKMPRWNQQYSQFTGDLSQLPFTSLFLNKQRCCCCSCCCLMPNPEVAQTFIRSASQRFEPRQLANGRQRIAVELVSATSHFELIENRPQGSQSQKGTCNRECVFGTQQLPAAPSRLCVTARDKWPLKSLDHL